MSKMNAGVTLTDIMDHCMVCISIPISAKLENNQKFFSNFDYNSIVSIILNENWIQVYETGYIIFEYTIKNANDKSTTRMLVKSMNKRLKEWITNGLLTSAYLKQYRSIKYKKLLNNLTLALHYKMYKKKFSKRVRLSKLKFYENKFKKGSSKFDMETS